MDVFVRVVEELELVLFGEGIFKRLLNVVLVNDTLSIFNVKIFFALVFVHFCKILIINDKENLLIAKFT